MHNSEQISGNWSIMPINKWTVCEMPEAQWREHEQHKAKAVEGREKLHSRYKLLLESVIGRCLGQIVHS